MNGILSPMGQPEWLSRPVTSTPALLAAARANLSDAEWDKLIGGVTDVDPSARLLGHHLRLPVLLANIGDPDLLWPGGAGAVAGAASGLGIPQLVAPDSHPTADGADPAGSGLRILEISSGRWRSSRRSCASAWRCWAPPPSAPSPAATCGAMCRPWSFRPS